MKLKSYLKLAFFLVLISFLTVIYKNDYVIFHLVDKLNSNTNNKFHLSYIRDQSIKYINELNPFVGKIALKFQDLPEINIKLSKKSIDTIQSSIENSKKKNTKRMYLSANDKKYSNAKIFYDGKKYDARIRLHGTDAIHFIKNKKSYYIKLKKDQYLENMRRFSLIILEDNSIATLFAYSLLDWFTNFKVNSFLVKVKINGVEQGVYLLEEKLHKTLLERNSLASYEIIKPNDEWDQQHSDNRIGTRHINPYNWDIASTRFENLTKKEIGQLKQYEKLYSCKEYDCLEFLIDEDNTAKIDALRVILGTDVIFKGDNQKLLYNTTTGRFVPFLRTEGVLQKLNYFFDKDLYGKNFEYKNNFLYLIGSSDIFRQKRNYYLWELIKEKKYLLKLYDDLYEKNLKSILTDNTHHSSGRTIKYYENLKKEIFKENLSTIEKYLSYGKISSNLRFIDKNKLKLSITPDTNTYHIIESIDFDFNGISEARILDEQTNQLSKIDLNKPIEYFKNKKFISGMNNSLEMIKKDYHFIINLKNGTSINNFKINFINSITNKKIQEKDNYFVFQKFVNFTDSINEKLLLKNEDEYIIKTGSYNLKDDLIIPYGKNLIIEPGVQLNIADNKSILVYGGLSINGNKDEQVYVKNLNKKFGTFASLGNKNTKIDINYLNLSGGSEAVINGVYFSGALSLHSHKSVNISNSRISNNFADDGVNIKNSKVYLKDNDFVFNFSDQIDLDNCTGSVVNNSFVYRVNKNIQNDNGDGLDLSYSKILVKENIFSGFVDKAVSVGERTNILIFKNNFSDNVRAITVKDESNAYLSKNYYENNEINIEQYRKKNFFEYPNVFNIDEKHQKEKIKKTSNSNYFFLNKDIKLDFNQNFEIILSNLEAETWKKIE